MQLSKMAQDPARNDLRRRAATLAPGKTPRFALISPPSLLCLLPRLIRHHVKVSMKAPKFCSVLADFNQSARFMGDTGELVFNTGTIAANSGVLR